MNQERFEAFMAAYAEAFRAKVVATGERHLNEDTLVRSRVSTARQAIYRGDYAPVRVSPECVVSAMARLAITPRGVESATKALDRYLERLV